MGDESLPQGNCGMYINWDGRLYPTRQWKHDDVFVCVVLVSITMYNNIL